MSKKAHAVKDAVEVVGTVAEEMNVIDEIAEVVVKKPSRASQIRKLFDSGMSRAEVAKELGIRYQVVYQATKDASNPHHNGTTTGRNTMITDPITGLPITRKDFFRREYAIGRTRLSLAREFNVPFQTVYQATRDVVTVTPKA